MQLPPGINNSEATNLVTWLKKAIYGLKQTGCTWYSALHKALEDLGFECSSYDHGVLFIQNAAGIVLLAIHIDNYTITGNNQPPIINHHPTGSTSNIVPR